MDSLSTNHAIKLYAEFGRNIGDDRLNLRLLNHHFTIFLEDVCVNDDTFHSMTHYEKVTFLGCLLLFNAGACVGTTATDTSSTFNFISIVMSQFADRNSDHRNLVAAYANSKYVWDDTTMYQWTGNVWVPCDNLDVGVFDPAKLSIHTYGLDNLVVQEACTSMDGFLKSIHQVVSDWNASPQSLKDLIKASPKTMNHKSHKITVFDGSLDLDTDTVDAPDPTDYSTLLIPYTPVQVEAESPVEKVFDTFKCDISQITHVLKSCLKGDRSIIFISGMAGSGCTALWTILKNACGPYADPMVDDHRAVFFTEEEVKILDDEDNMDSYPTMVFDCPAPARMKSKYCGRQILRINLDDVIDVDECVVDIEISYSTRVRLSYVLGYLLLPQLQLQDEPMSGLEKLLGADIMNSVDDDVDNIDFTSLGYDIISRAFSMMGKSDRGSVD